jgi:hypothetical protein
MRLYRNGDDYSTWFADESSYDMVLWPSWPLAPPTAPSVA